MEITKDLLKWVCFLDRYRCNKKIYLGKRETFIAANFGLKYTKSYESANPKNFSC